MIIDDLIHKLLHYDDDLSDDDILDIIKLLRELRWRRSLSTVELSDLHNLAKTLKDLRDSVLWWDRFDSLSFDNKACCLGCGKYFDPSEIIQLHTVPLWRHEWKKQCPNGDKLPAGKCPECGYYCYLAEG